MKTKTKVLWWFFLPSLPWIYTQIKFCSTLYFFFNQTGISKHESPHEPLKYRLGQSHPPANFYYSTWHAFCSFQVCFQNLFDDTIKLKFLKMNYHWIIFRFLIGVFFFKMKYYMLRLIDKWFIISVFLPKSLRSTVSLAISYNICHVKLRQIGI